MIDLRPTLTVAAMFFAAVCCLLLADCSSEPRTRPYLNQATENCLAGDNRSCGIMRELSDQYNEERTQNILRAEHRDYMRTVRFGAMQHWGASVW